jgi:hypothetical protein
MLDQTLLLTDGSIYKTKARSDNAEIGGISMNEILAKT